MSKSATCCIASPCLMGLLPIWLNSYDNFPPLDKPNPLMSFIHPVFVLKWLTDHENFPCSGSMGIILVRKLCCALQFREKESLILTSCIFFDAFNSFVVLLKKNYLYYVSSVRIKYSSLPPVSFKRKASLFPFTFLPYSLCLHSFHNYSPWTKPILLQDFWVTHQI